MKFALRLAFLLVFALPLVTEVAGQPLGGPPPCWPPPCIPIDGGLGFLIAAGALLGGSKALEMRRQQRR
jgi:hypothetical protein